MVRYRKKMVRPLRMAFMAFTATAAWAASKGMVKKRASNWNTGFPGGWPTSSLYDDAINSPQSQKDAVGSMVARYVAHDASSTATATIQFHLLNVFLSIK